SAPPPPHVPPGHSAAAQHGRPSFAPPVQTAVPRSHASPATQLCPAAQSAAVVHCVSTAPEQCGKSTISSPQRGSRQAARQWLGAVPFDTAPSHSSPGSTNPLPHAMHPPTHGPDAPQSVSVEQRVATAAAQCGETTIAEQSAVHASAPPESNPLVAQVSPRKAGCAPPIPPGSHASPGEASPSPHTATQPLVSKVQSDRHASRPLAKPRDAHVAPARSLPSQSSPGCTPGTVPHVSGRQVH